MPSTRSGGKQTTKPLDEQRRGVVGDLVDQRLEAAAAIQIDEEEIGRGERA